MRQSLSERLALLKKNYERKCRIKQSSERIHEQMKALVLKQLRKEIREDRRAHPS